MERHPVQRVTEWSSVNNKNFYRKNKIDVPEPNESPRTSPQKFTFTPFGVQYFVDEDVQKLGQWNRCKREHKVRSGTVGRIIFPASPRPRAPPSDLSFDPEFLQIIANHRTLGSLLPTRYFYFSG